MAGENYTLPEVPVYREAIRKILNEDPVNAEEILNPLVQALLENIHFVKLLAEQKAENSALDAHTGDDTAHLTAEERTVWNGKAAGDHRHTAADVGAIPTSQKGAANGVASLGTDAKVPKAQLPASEGKRTARFTVGTSAAGWTADQVDYLCDGTADQVEINAAITALPATGGEVVILDGTYNLTGVILVNKNNVTLSGNGNSTKLVRAFSGSITEPGMIYVTSSNNTIKYLQLDGVKDTYSGSNNSGIYLYGSPNNTIIWNTCNNNNNNGIYLYNSANNNTITGNTCNNNSSGIYLYRSTDNTITGNTCNNNNANGICLNSSNNNNTITGNTCNINNNGICLYSSAKNNTITGNTCNNNNASGIDLNNSASNTITGNTCNNNNNGIYLYNSDSNTITGNTCNINNANGIYLNNNASSNTIIGNTCKNNNNNGIYLDSNNINNTITGNTCINNANGIYLYSNNNNNTITGNTCIRITGTSADYTSDQNTISVTGNNNLIVGNNIMGKNYTNSGTGNTFANNKYAA